jgi:hypothetical protein
VSAISRPVAGGLLLALRVTPRASRNAVAGLHRAADGAAALAVKVAAAPDRGMANKAAIAVMSEALGLPKSSFSIVAGETGRHKSVRVAGNPKELEALIAALVAQVGDA